METKKYGLDYGLRVCFRCGPVAASVKLILEILNGLLMPLMVLVVASFINHAVAYGRGDGTLIPVFTALALMAAYYGYTQISPILLRLADTALSNSLGQHLQPQLIRKHTRIPYEQLENPETLDLITRIFANASKTMMGILNNGLMLIRLGIQGLGTLSLLAIHAWWMLPLFLASALPIVWIAHKGGKAIYASDAITTKLTRRHYYLSSVLVGRETAAERTLFGYGDAINRKFSEAHLTRSNMVTREIAIEEITINACGLILNGLVLAAVVVLLGPVGTGSLSHGLYVSLVGALIGLVRMLTGSVSRLVSDASGMRAFMGDYSRFLALPERAVDSVCETKSLGFDSLVVRNLRFRYTPESDYVLNGVNLTLEKGKSYSLIGKNGAGKSTLTKILLGLYRDFEGEVLINGRDIAQYSAEDLRRIFSIVYQDFAKYFIPLEENITLGRKDGDLPAALRLAGLEDVIEKLPKQERTALGKIFDGGVDISGGEWQRVAIARALYAGTPFMILDEPTASLSPMAESKLYGRFGEIAKDKTALLISHRLGSTKLSDVLFVLEEGVIVETGTHDALMAAEGIYAEMFKSQRSWYDERS